MINISYEPNELVIKIPKNLTTSNYVQRFLQHLKIESSLANSQATDADIENLSESIKTDWWLKNKERFCEVAQIDCCDCRYQHPVFYSVT